MINLKMRQVGYFQETDTDVFTHTTYRMKIARNLWSEQLPRSFNIKTV